MSLPELSLSAETPTDLLSQLRNINITVPSITKDRSNRARERYVMARFLATKAESELVCYPLTIKHRDKPDFALHHQNGEVGVECVEAVPDEWYRIQEIQDRDFPGALTFGQHFRPGKHERVFTDEERIEVANGSRTGYPWVGNLAEKQWAEAMEFFIESKTEKLRSGNYSEFQNMWLLIQDEWRVPMHSEEEVREGAKMCLTRISKFLTPPCFSTIYICCRGWLLSFENGHFTMEPIRDLWRKD